MRAFWQTMAFVILTTILFFQMGCRSHIYPLKGVSNVCGNEVCDKGEDPENCPKDCEKGPLQPPSEHYQDPDRMKHRDPKKDPPE
jgi:hypothetical protein